MKVVELLKTKKQYCTDYVAVDRDGDPVEPYDPNAVAWSLIGAIMKCYPLDTLSILNQIKERAKEPYVAVYESKVKFPQIKKLLQELDI